MEANNSTLAAIVTAVISLTTAGYQFNKAELAEMQSTVKTLIAENKSQEIDKKIDEKKRELQALGDLAYAYCKGLAEDSKKNPVIPQMCNAPEIKNAIESASKTSDLLTIFIQVKKGDQQALNNANLIQTALRNSGYRVPNIEQVTAVPKASELRYLYDEDKAATEKLNAALKTIPTVQSMQTSFAVKVLPKKYEGKTPRKTVELWFRETKSK
ncbi:MAG: hypothetical protein RL018_1812 [Pseudomonadota bacterium]|jgi:uncharacterized pyridoxal phosphate-containing UPF0001 family protein